MKAITILLLGALMMGCGTKQLPVEPEVSYSGHDSRVGHMFLRNGKPFVCTHVWRDDGKTLIGCVDENKTAFTCDMLTEEAGYFNNCRLTKPDVGF